MLNNIFIAILAGMVAGSVLMALGNRRVPVDVARARWKKLAGYFLIVSVTLACAAAGHRSMLALMVVVVVLGAAELRRATAEPAFGTPGQRVVTWLVFVLIATAAVLSVPRLSVANCVYLYLVVAVFDGFSQVTGQLLGRHRLAPRLSPGKTLEGALGGLLAASISGVLFRMLAWPDPAAALLLSLAIAATGLAGDLLASWVKRRAGIKDFGRLLPGQGGVLDRYDSFLAVSAIIGPIMHVVAVR